MCGRILPLICPIYSSNFTLKGKIAYTSVGVVLVKFNAHQNHGSLHIL